jgi:ABC-type phosphate transport system substrate-binding protein
MTIMKKLNKIMIGASLLLMTASTQAWADIVVIVSAERTAPPLTLKQIARIFEGKSNLMTPVDIIRPSSTRRDFYTKVVGLDEAQAIALWSKLIFTGKVAAPKQYASGAEVVEAVAANPNVIGYVDSSFVNMTVKVIFTVK